MSMSAVTKTFVAAVMVTGANVAKFFVAGDAGAKV
jgi:hypothetical protein